MLGDSLDHIEVLVADLLVLWLFHQVEAWNPQLPSKSPCASA